MVEGSRVCVVTAALCVSLMLNIFLVMNRLDPKVLQTLDGAALAQGLSRFEGPRRGELIIWIQGILRSLDGAGQGGAGIISDAALQKNLANPGLYDVRNHLQSFTGLGNVELHRRLARYIKFMCVCVCMYV